MKRSPDARPVAYWGATALASLLLVGVSGIAGAATKAEHASIQQGRTDELLSSKSSYVLPAILSLTGTAASFGQEEKASLIALQNQINRTGGIDGHPLQIKFYDNQTSGSVAVSLATPLVNHVPVMLVGSVQTTDLPVDALDTSKKTVIYDLSPGDYPAFHSYIYSAAASTNVNAIAAVNYAESHHWNRIAVINTTDSSGVDGFKSMQAAVDLTRGKVKIIAHESFDPTSVSVTAQMTKIGAARPQMLVAWTTGSPVVTILQAMQQLGLEKMPVMTSWSNADPALLTHVKNFVPNDLMFAGPPFLAGPTGNSPGVNRAVAEFDSVMKGVGISPPGSGEGTVWDPAMIEINALRKFGVSATASQIHRYIDHLDGYSGVMGTYNFTEKSIAAGNRGLGLDTMVVTRWNPTTATFERLSGPGGKPLS